MLARPAKPILRARGARRLTGQADSDTPRRRSSWRKKRGKCGGREGRYRSATRRRQEGGKKQRSGGSFIEVCASCLSCVDRSLLIDRVLLRYAVIIPCTTLADGHLPLQHDHFRVVVRCSRQKTLDGISAAGAPADLSRVRRMCCSLNQKGDSSAKGVRCTNDGARQASRSPIPVASSHSGRHSKSGAGKSDNRSEALDVHQMVCVTTRKAFGGKCWPISVARSESRDAQW